MQLAPKDPVAGTTVGVDVLVVKPTGNVAVIVLPATSAPVLDVVNAQVHVDAVFAPSELGAVDVPFTAVTDVPVIVAAVVVDAAVTVSLDVESVKPPAVTAPAMPVLTTPIVNVPVVVLPNEHVPVSVITMTFVSLGSEPVAVQLAPKDPVLGTTVGVVVLVVKPEGNVAVIVAPALSAPEPDVVNAQVHVDAVFATSDEGADDVPFTAVTDVPAVMVALVVVDATVVVSNDVDRVKLPAVTAPAVPVLTTPTVNVPVVELPREHVPVSVITTTFVSLASEPVAVQLGPKDPVPGTTVGVVVLVVKPEGNVAVIVAPALSAPELDVVNAQVHVDAADATSDEGADEVPVTAVTDVAVIVSPVVALAALVSADVKRLKVEPV